MELKTTTELVKTILTENPDTRNNDKLLYVEITKYYSEKFDFDICGYPFASVLLNLDSWGLPPIETVGRCRRKLQHDYPELCGNDTVEGFRKVKEAEFRDYARGTV